ncbi:D-sedoheptulose-7-phosphate isomerase [Litorivicinus lipolyticus]|uniref:D-sedoheptulose-7-phosphate isomerase n=1 Tax=Litorivicinus lipolyticus TaxID=418701 RepID=UPI003B5B9A32
MHDAIIAGLKQSLDHKQAMLNDHGLHESIAAAAALCRDALANGGKLLLCGNGGSAADCQHIAAELVGRFEIERDALAAIALTTDTSALTAIGNDYGYEQVFSRQVAGLGQPGDVLIGFSTSGGSKNVVKAFEVAAKRGVKTIAMTGAKAGPLTEMSDVWVACPSTRTANIQEGHITIGHLLCALIES